MANLQETQTYGAGVYQLETTDPVLAGPDGISNLQAKQLANRTAWLKQQISSLGTGMIGIFATATEPTGWLKCKGQAISRTDYANLFAAIGTTFGPGDDSSTFNVPDLRGQFIRGYNEDASEGDDPGRTFGSSQDGQNLTHTHGEGSYSTDTDAHLHTFKKAPEGTEGGTGTSVSGTDIGPAVDQSTTWDVHSHDVTGYSSPSGGDEVRPKNIALAYFIKT